MDTVLMDTHDFFEMLYQKYNIVMFEQTSNRLKRNYIGEIFTMYGERYLLLVEVVQGKTLVRVLKATGQQRVCVFQKMYSTVNDKKALSKSISLFNYLDKLLYCSVM